MKYTLTKETKTEFGIKLYRIKALKDFGDVSKGDKGGWIEKESNLSQEDNAWVYGDARVYGNAQVSGNARVYGDAQVSGNARVYGDAWVYGDARVSGNAWVSGDARVWKFSISAGYFFGIRWGDEEIKFHKIDDNELIYKGDAVIEEEPKQEPEEMIEIDGKKWSKETIKEALKKHAN